MRIKDLADVTKLYESVKDLEKFAERMELDAHLVLMFHGSQERVAKANVYSDEYLGEMHAATLAEIKRRKQKLIELGVEV